MKRVIYSAVAFFCFVIMNFCFISKVDAASTVRLGNDTYTVNESNEYESTNKVKWITIKSDRAQGSRMSIEMDLSLIKDTNSNNGKISYKAIKNWMNSLEKCFDYFCELNLNPQNTTLVVECTGVSKQYASAYANGGSNNKIVMNKSVHIGTLELIERDYNSGITNLCGTVLHEMGHMFTKINGYGWFNDTPWNYGTEYINMAFEQYVVDKMIKNNSNIVTNLTLYYDTVCASNNINTYFDLNGNSIKYVEHNFKDAWYATSELNNISPDYSKVIYHTSEIINAIGQTAFKKVCNSYFNNDLSKYDLSNDYNKFMTFMSIAKANTTSTIWNKVTSHYDFLYNKFVVNIKLKNEKVNLAKGKSYKVDCEITYNSGNHDNFSTLYESSNKNVATIDSNGNVTCKNVGETMIFVRVGNQYATITVNVVEGVTSITLDKTEMTVTGLSSSYTLKANVVPNLNENPIKWTSSDESVVTVNQDGKFTPKKYGTAIITVTTTDGTNLSASCKINVAKLVLNKTMYTFNQTNQSLSLSATVYPSYFSQNVSWRSTNKDVAVVNDKGVVTPIGKGNCFIFATTTDGTSLVSGCDVTSNVEVGFSESTYLFDYELTKAVNLPEIWKDLEVTQYSIDNTNIAFMVSDNLVGAKNKGTTTLRAKVKLPSGKLKEITTNIKVDLKIRSIKLKEETLNFTENESQKLELAITPSSASNKKMKWTSSNTKVAIVSNTGVVTPVGKGNCTITATTTDGTNLSATCNVVSNVDYLKGDINNDRKVNMIDVYYGMKGMSQGTLTKEEIQRGDVTGDGKFNMTDVNKMLQYIAGKIESLK